MDSKTVCFYVYGNDFTNLVRSIWADERNPEKALGMLRAAFPTMEESDVVAILTGSKKLEGDSREGPDLVSDDTKETKVGNHLSLDSVLSGFRRKVEEAEDLLQLAVDNVKILGSPVGLIAIPRRRVDEYASGLVQLDDIAYRRVSRQEAMEQTARTYLGIEKIDIEQEAPPPPAPESKISHNFGWLSPDGKFYRCEWMEHIWLAGALGFKEANLEKRGWIKVEKGELFQPDRPATQKQIDLIFDWYTARNKELPSWLLEE